MTSTDTGVKRNRVSLNVAQKLELIDKLEQGVSVAEVCKIYGVKKQTVSDIRKSKAKLQQFSLKYSANSAECGLTVGNRKHMKLAQDKQLEEAVFNWYVIQRSSGVNIRSLDLKFAYETFGKHMGLNVKSSDGWLWRFKKRHGIVLHIKKDSEQVWTSEDIESLISLVQIHSVIYDQSDPDYNNREIVEMHWQQIGNKIKQTPESCSKKWQLLYSEYKQRKKNQNVHSNTKTNEWPHFNSIDFLQDYLPEVFYDQSPSVDNITALQDLASFSRLSKTPQSNIYPEKVLINENTLSSDGNVDIKVEIEDGNDDNFMEMPDHTGNDISNDIESCSRLDVDYLDNEIDSNCSLHESKSYSKAENDDDKNAKTDTFKNGKCNSMELFLLSLVDDASSLSKPAQRIFKSKVLALLDSLQ